MGATPTIELANLGMADSLILMVLALVVFGPRRLPQIGRQIGKLMFEFRKASNDFKFQMEEELRLSEEAERRKKEEEERKRAAELAASAQASVSAPPAQSIEAQADIGAVEAPAASLEPVSASPATSSVDSNNSAQNVLDETPQQVISIPRLQPPQTGEPVAAAHPSGAVSDGASRSPESPGLPSSNGAHAEPAPPAGDSPAIGQDSPVAHREDESATPPKEPMTQHG